MWQKCPNCNGAGVTYYPMSISTSAVCDVCKGRKIIHQLSGLPPASKDEGTDFRDGNMESQQEYFGKK